MSRGTGNDGLLQCFDHPESDVGRGFRTDQMQRKNGELVPAEPGYQIAVAHGAEQALRNDSKNLIPDPVPVYIVDLLEAVQVEKDESVDGAFSWRSGARCFERIIKLPPIGEPRQSIL